MSHPVEPSYGGLACAALFLILPAALSLKWQLGLHRDLVIGGLRCIGQLVLVGYVLRYVFELNALPVTLLVLAVMVTAGGQTALSRQSVRLPGMFGTTTLAIFTTSALTLLYATVVIVKVRPWYDARYLIPLAGMVVGNAMNGSSLAAERLGAELKLRRQSIEALLALGAGPRQATAEAVRATIRASLIPAVNSLMSVGLVHLPGMMTGQMLGGASPVTAVRYQVMIFYALTFVSASTAILITSLLYRCYFTARMQLRTALLLNGST